jgi:CubicO group peptidase (beta-lactamase class C family)
MFRRMPLLIACLLFCAPALAQPMQMAKPESVGVSSRQLAQIGIVMQREIDNKTTPGVVVPIARRGKLVYLEAFGKLDDAKGIPMPKDAIFPIASMTKPLTTVGALALYEQGRLFLNEPVGQYLPQLDKMVVATATGTEPAHRKPTVQDMMRHTGGVTYGAAEGVVGVGELSRKYGTLTNGDPTTGEFLDRLGALPLQYQPGTKWAYSLGLDVTGMVEESITRQRLGDYLHTSIFAPLGMTDTSFTVPAGKLARVAMPVPSDPAKQKGFDAGGGGAWSTASDYLRFACCARAAAWERCASWDARPWSI